VRILAHELGPALDLLARDGIEIRPVVLEPYAVADGGDALAHLVSAQGAGPAGRSGAVDAGAAGGKRSAPVASSPTPGHGIGRTGGDQKHQRSHRDRRSAGGMT